MLKFTNRSSALAFEDASFSAPNGIQLIKGRLILDKENFAYNDNATSQSDGIILGDGVAEDNNLIERGVESTLESQSGFIVDKTV